MEKVNASKVLGLLQEAVASSAITSAPAPASSALPPRPRPPRPAVSSEPRARASRPPSQLLQPRPRPPRPRPCSPRPRPARTQVRVWDLSGQRDTRGAMITGGGSLQRSSRT
ncbi:hypothetical protein DFH09DRAFT_1072211 [Mycena vulgaris]|nr:hypothetical protein DFH09DRAFT_1072211 [Mycena vulgaris]